MCDAGAAALHDADGARLQYTGAMTQQTTAPTGNTAPFVDGKRRFLFEEMDLRGEIVHLEGVLREVNEIHAYPRGVAHLLGEFLASAVLLASNLKFRGSLTVQARSEAQVPLMMAECSSDLTVRAIARGGDGATAQDFPSLLGGGILTLTVTPARGKRYQGIVPLSGHSLAATIDSYFSQSEQLQTRLYLACDGARSAVRSTPCAGRLLSRRAIVIVPIGHRDQGRSEATLVRQVVELSAWWFLPAFDDSGPSA